jgi:hypothetical protein
MAWYMKFYYFVPMFTLAIIALLSSVISIYGNDLKVEINPASLIIGLITLIVSLWAYKESEGRELYKDISKSFGDSGFDDFLNSLFNKEGKEYEKILQRH